MKNILKKLLLVSMCLGFVVGCGNSKIDLDLDKIKEEISNLEMDEISVPTIASNLSDYFPNAEFIYEYDFNERFGLNSDDIEEYAIAIDDETKDMYFILKTTDDKKEEVKEIMSNYFTQLISDQTDEIITKLENRKEEEYQGILIYIVSNDNDEIIDVVKNSKDPIFGMMMYADDESLSQTFNINSEDVEEYLIATPMMIVNSNTYIIVKPKSDKKDDIKKEIDEYISNLETQWSMYLPDQYELVKNRFVKEYEDYLIYIISNDNEKVYDVIVK